MKTWSTRTIVVLGACGMLGRSLMPALERRVRGCGGKMLPWGRTELDITDRASVKARITDTRPSVVINCAAYTDVDGCESDAPKARAVNGDAPGFLAEACAKTNALLVHYSTDFVFDGAAHAAYRVDDQPNPLSVYGQSKLQGELEIKGGGCRYLIVRTSWLYGPYGRNFVESILARVEKGEPLKVVNDQIGRPTYTRDLSEATIRLLDAEAAGLVHFANSGSCSWHEFASEIVHRSGCDVRVLPISSHALGRPARRPPFSVLDLSVYERLTGNTPRHWTLALEEYLQRRKAGDQMA